MDKLQALHNFWSGFGWPAYNGTTVPDGAEPPYITHELPISDFGTVIAQTATLWNRASGWNDILDKAKEIVETISRGGKYVEYDGGALHIRLNQAGGQDINDPDDDTIRGYILNYELEYLD